MQKKLKIEREKKQINKGKALGRMKSERMIKRVRNKEMRMNLEEEKKCRKRARLFAKGEKLANKHHPNASEQEVVAASALLHFRDLS